MGIDPKTLKEDDEVVFNDRPKDIYDVKVNGPSSVLLGRVNGNAVEMIEIHYADLSSWKHMTLVGKSLQVSAGGHPRFLALLDQLRAMHLAKSADYGTADDVYANYRRTAKLGIPPSKGILIRMADKWSRIETWANGGTLKNEGVVDSLLDLASYALGAVVMIEEEANGK